MKILKRLIIFCESGVGPTIDKIIQKIANNLDLPVLKMISPRSHFRKGTGSLTEFSFVFNQVLYQLRHTNYIVDNGLMFNLIDREIYKKKSKLSYIYSLIKKIDPLVIFFTTSKKSMLFEKKLKKLSVSFSKKIKILNGYESYFKTQQMVSVLTIDIANKTSIEIANEILKYLEKEKFIEI